MRTLNAVQRQPDAIRFDHGNSIVSRRAWLANAVAVGFIGLLNSSCRESPTEPRDTTLAVGRWVGDGACLSVAQDGCDLVVGCGHGRFPVPAIRADGTFTVDGTYRIEAGPVSVNPPPAAMFSGTVGGQTLTLNVIPSDPSLRPASYVMQLTNASGRCSVPCV